MATKKTQLKSQKNQQMPDMTEAEARSYIEAMRWPDGPVCPHCKGTNVYRMTGDSIRNGLLACRECRGHFTVTVGTVMEDSHLSLPLWVRAFHLMSTSKKGMSALQLQRNLGLGSYKTAWHLAHRIREAMRCEPVKGMLKGDVQIDETYVGASRNGKNLESGKKPRGRGRATTKIPVVALIETNGNAYSQPVKTVNAKTLGSLMKKIVDRSARIVTDEFRGYIPPAKNFADHSTVNHSIDQYVNPEGFHVNTAEAYFALLKRGVHGMFHHISAKHLHRYCNEFSFRWNGRQLEDVARRDAAVKGSEGKRLMYRMPVAKPKPETNAPETDTPDVPGQMPMF
jgi:transposase-like protein